MPFGDQVIQVGKGQGQELDNIVKLQVQVMVQVRVPV